MPPATHSRISPSGLKRVIHCPGSVALLDTVPSKTSAYADEGSAAHCLAERCLAKGQSAREYLGRRIVPVDGGWSILKPGATRKDGYEVTPEMVLAVQKYTDVVKERVGEDGILLVEQRVSLEHWATDMGGTADAVVVHPLVRLSVLDLKYGQGVRVDAADEDGTPNPQAMCYALGALGPDNEHMVEAVEIVIVQPRYRDDGHIDSIVIPVEDLYRWADEVLVPAVRTAEQPGAPLCAGEWCKSTFCDAYSVCPQVREQMFAEIEVVEKDGVPVPVRLPAWSELTPMQRGRLLDAITLFEGWAKDIKSAANADAQRGVVPHGYKCVAGRASKRWLDEAQAVAGLSGVGVDPYERKLLTPAAAEKAVKAAGLAPGMVVGPLIEITRGVTLAPISDKRPALPAPAERMFGDVNPGDEEDPLA